MQTWKIVKNNGSYVSNVVGIIRTEALDIGLTIEEVLKLKSECEKVIKWQEQKKTSPALEFKVGDSVIVPEGNPEDDAWVYSFVGTVACVLDNGDVIVEDMNSYSFQVEAYRLKMAE